MLVRVAQVGGAMKAEALIEAAREHREVTLIILGNRFVMRGEAIGVYADEQSWLAVGRGSRAWGVPLIAIEAWHVGEPVCN